MITDDFKIKVQEIHEKEKEFTITPRELLHAFKCEKRTKWNVARINQYLEENKLITIPNFINSWIDGEIILKHKKKAKSKREDDPIQRIKLLPAANKKPVSISRDAKLSEAVTLMMMHNFSQLPVMQGDRKVFGVITWETIGISITNGNKSEFVKDHMQKEIKILDYETPLLKAISEIIKNDFALVKKSDETISGIVTIADISSQFLNITEPFLLLEQIENHIRQILDGKFLIEELKELCKIGEEERNIEFIDDLNFGDYIRIIGNPDNWKKLNLSVERAPFIKQLDKVREIRNDIMHFDPEGITDEQREDLNKMSKFLMTIVKYS